MNDETQMLYINGSKVSYRCECGANVFKKMSEHVWRCNGCKALHSDLTDDDLTKNEVKLVKKPYGDLWIKIFQLLLQTTVLDPMTSIRVSNEIIELIDKEV